jgi:signal transduction histidine kinase
MVTHELRNPLNALAGWLHLIGTEPAMTSGVGERAIAGARRALEQQLAQIDLLGQVLRLAGGGVAAADASLAFGELVQAQCVAAVAEAAHDGSVRGPGALRIEGAAPEGLRVLADRALLEASVKTLAGFALRHGMPGAPLEVRISVSGQAFEVGLRIDEGDDGGLSIWHGFGESASRLSLDLYLAMLVIESHGGTVRPRRAAQGGEELEIRLPVAPMQPAIPVP